MYADDRCTVAVHTLLIHGARAAGLASRLKAMLREVEGDAGAGTLITVWSCEDLRDSVLLALPRGALPAAVEQLRGLQARYGTRAMVTGGVLALGGAAPAIVDGLLGEAGLAEWLAPLTPAVRLHVGAQCRVGGHAATPIRLGYASAGHDLQWLVPVDGVECDQVARAVTAAAGHPVTAAPVEAYDEETHHFRPMVLIRAGPSAAAAMDNLVGRSEQLLRIGGTRLTLRRFTCTRSSGHRSGGARAQPDRLHGAALREERHSRAATFELTVDRQPADAIGRP